LLTGKAQSQCTRNLKVGSSSGASGAPSASSSGSSDDGSEGTVGSEETATDSAPEPTIPSSCDAKAWEPYFAQLATHEYGDCGVDITFPQSIFDTSKTLAGVAWAGAGASSTAGAPSCHDGEWQMRQQSWLDAVSKGCMNLNDAILVMCQQAANYAPSTGKCSATGTW
jgi:hypothetical protein